MDIQSALEIDGWMTDRELRWLADVASRCRTIIEVGSFRGRSTIAMAANSDATIWCVDTWDTAQEGRLIGDTDFVHFLRNTWPYRKQIIPIRLDAAKAATLLQEKKIQAGLVFIDASHDYNSVAADIRNYRPLVKDGGILAGHDYNPGTWDGVVKAVDELCGPVDGVRDTIWYKEQP